MGSALRGSYDARGSLPLSVYPTPRQTDIYAFRALLSRLECATNRFAPFLAQAFYASPPQAPLYGKRTSDNVQSSLNRNFCSRLVAKVKALMEILFRTVKEFREFHVTKETLCDRLACIFSASGDQNARLALHIFYLKLHALQRKC